MPPTTFTCTGSGFTFPQIFSFLGMVEIVRVSLVCRHWRAAVTGLSHAG